MEILLSSLYIIVACLIIRKVRFFSVDGIPRTVFIGLFLVKILSAFALTMIYTYYYTDRITADIFKYFDDAKILYSAARYHTGDYFRMVTGIDTDAAQLKEYFMKCSYWYKKYDHLLYNDNRTIIRFNALVMLFSGGLFFVHNVFMSFLSLIGLTAIYKIFVDFYPHKKHELIVAVFLLPSVLLWTSGALKEGLVVCAFGLFFFSLWNLIHKHYNWYYVVWFIVSFYILTIAKYYVVACALPGVLFLIGKRFLPELRNITILLLVILLCSACLILGALLGGPFDVINTLSLKQNDFVRFAMSLQNVGSLIDTNLLQPSVVDFLKHSPQALVNSLFRPFPWEVHNFMALIPALENIALEILLVWAFVSYLKKKHHVVSRLLGFSFLFVVGLNLLNGLIVPVTGALVRYKVPAMPFLFASLVCVCDFSFLRRRKNIE